MWRGVTVALWSTKSPTQQEPITDRNTHTQLSIDVFNLKHVKLCEESKFTSFL